MAVADWGAFTAKLRSIFEQIEREVPSTAGNPADYIPALAMVDPTRFGFAITTVDGQQYACGDLGENVSIQSCVKPLVYAISSNENGSRAVHSHVGIAPSGLLFNEVTLNEAGLPHNPMINSGAIATAGTFNPIMGSSQRYKHLVSRLAAMAGGVKSGFSQSVYLSEKATAYRNQALVHYMSEGNKVFTSETMKGADALDFYLQSCSLETSTAQLANIAAMLAKGGISPLTGEVCLDPSVVKTTLTLMFSCGMYDYSGTWCMTVGLPAKSGVGGMIYIVVPNVMGMALFAPPLDSRGNSVRGIALAKAICGFYKLSMFDQIVLNSHPVVEGKATFDGTALEGLGDDASALSIPNAAAPDDPSLLHRANSVVVDDSHSRARALHRMQLFLSKFRRLYFAFRKLDPTRAKGEVVRKVPAEAIRNLLAKARLPLKSKYLSALLREVTDLDGYCSFDAILTGQETELNPICKCLIDDLAVPEFDHVTSVLDYTLQTVSFCRINPDARLHIVLEDATRHMRRMADEAIRRAEGYLQTNIDAIGISICTVDGQLFKYGDHAKSFPLNTIADVLLYAIALDELGTDAVHDRVDTEPVSMPRDTFKLNDHSSEVSNGAKVLRPYNPFLDTGALALASMVHAGADPGTRFEHIAKRVSQFAGGRKIAFDQEAYLSFSRDHVRIKALSQFCKGFGILGDEDPDVVSDIFFQTQSLDVDCETLAIIAGTIANCGFCPTTRKQVIDVPSVRNVLSTMYSCGMNETDGWWNFHVGIPAKSDSNGALFLVVPNVLGMVIHIENPRKQNGKLPAWPISIVGALLAKQLSLSYQWNLFANDNLAEEDDLQDDGAMASGEMTTAFFVFCTDIKNKKNRRVDLLLKEYGMQLAAMADYDGRTAMHIAASEGNEHALKALLRYGASPIAKDRWGNSPLSDAITWKHKSAQDLLEPVVEEVMEKQREQQKNATMTGKGKGKALFMTPSRPKAKQSPNGRLGPKRNARGGSGADLLRGQASNK